MAASPMHEPEGTLTPAESLSLIEEQDAGPGRTCAPIRWGSSCPGVSRIWSPSARCG